MISCRGGRKNVFTVVGLEPGEHLNASFSEIGVFFKTEIGRPGEALGVLPLGARITT
jgi:hypothetical protein